MVAASRVVSAATQQVHTEGMIIDLRAHLDRGAGLAGSIPWRAAPTVVRIW